MRDRGGGDGTGGAVASAIELAVLSSVAHPNIVSVYACLTNMVRLAADGAAACLDEKLSTRAGPLRFRPARAADGPAAPTYTLAVLQYCDRGTLRDAVAAGAFHESLEGGAIAVDLPAVVEVLIAVARALTYLHRLSVLHGDLKMANVLLASDPTAPAGVTPKLADLGLAKMLRGTDHVINHSGSGTVTHLAPEMFVHGTRVTAAVDVYAFGVLMWEVFTARRPYAGLSRAAIIHRVLHRGLRPVFPAGAPRAYAGFAAACWAHDPAARPAMGDVARALRGVAAGLRAAVGGSGGGGGGGAGCAAAPVEE